MIVFHSYAQIIKIDVIFKPSCPSDQFHIKFLFRVIYWSAGIFATYTFLLFLKSANHDLSHLKIFQFYRDTVSGDGGSEK